MLQPKKKLQVFKQWNEYRNYRLGDSVSYNGTIYTNTTGINTMPSLLTNWIAEETLTLQTLSTLTNSATAKTTLLDTDTIVGNDSVTPFGLIKITLLNVWNYLKTKVEALLSEQIIISTSTATADSSWHNRTVIFTSNCVVTISGTLPANFVFNGIKLTGVSVTFGITSPKVWLDSTPPTLTGARSVFNIVQQGTTNNVMYNG